MAQQKDEQKDAKRPNVRMSVASIRYELKKNLNREYDHQQVKKVSNHRKLVPALIDLAIELKLNRLSDYQKQKNHIFYDELKYFTVSEQDNSITNFQFAKRTEEKKPWLFFRQ